MKFNTKEFNYFDAHVHFYPERLFRAVRDWFATHSDWKLSYSTELDEIAAFLTNAGVERFFFFNYAHKPNMSFELNRWNYEVAKRYPSAIALGTVHAGDDNPLAVVQECFDKYNFSGLKIHIEVQRFAPDDERLWPVYEEVLAKGRFIVMHVGTAPWANEFCGIDRFAPLMARYNNLKMVIAHMGLFETARFFKMMDQYPELRMDTAMAFGPLMMDHMPEGFTWDAAQIERYCDRIIFGSDFPNLPYDYEHERLGLLALGLKKESYQKIFYHNAMTLLASTNLKK